MLSGPLHKRETNPSQDDHHSRNLLILVACQKKKNADKEYISANLSSCFPPRCALLNVQAFALQNQVFLHLVASPYFLQT